MKKSRLFGAVCACILVLTTTTINAATVTIDAANYNIGDDVSNAPGATLAKYSHASLAPSITYDPLIIGSVDYELIDNNGASTQHSLNTLGGATWGNTLLTSVVYGETLDQQGPFGGVSITSNDRILSFGATAFGFPGDTISVYLFDKNENILGTPSISGTLTPNCGSTYGYPRCYSYTYSVDLGTQDVYKIMLGSGLSAAYITGVTYSVVPIPPALWLFGSGLLGLIGIARRRMS